jgi:pimeloyl-ACP methyl ester carboxylesterase
VALIASSLSNITKIILIDPLQAGIKSNLPVIGLKAMLKSNTNNNELSPLTLDHKGYNFLLSLVTEGTLTKIKYGLNSISCPLFVLFGEDDELIPASKSLVYINVEASHAQYLCTAVIPGANHSPVLTHFKQSYEKMLQFLKI